MSETLHPQCWNSGALGLDTRGSWFRDPGLPVRRHRDRKQPSAGPWRRMSGKDAFIEMALAFPALCKGTWRRDGRCVYADDHVSITLVHETGNLPNVDACDNRAIWLSRLNDEAESDRIWTVDLDSEACEAFWKRNPA